ncbi:universal stress protein [Streptomyces sp. NPDC048669]|uniref:universal stress protein n=1 Tax=Streptomyces sp. NPDC048669 TaxID=3155267 RepID=UPI00342DD73F
MSGSSVRSVVVGVDASAHAQAALDWAADEAVLRGVPLRIAHAWTMAPHRVPGTGGVGAAKSLLQAAEEILARAGGRAQARHSGLRVDFEVLPEEAVPGLIRLAHDAELLVVGSRGLGRFRSVLIGSVSQSLVAHAPCPVVVFRGPSEAADQVADRAEPSDTSTRCDPGAVVLGAAPCETAGPVAFAFAEAARRGVSLLAVRTWTYPASYSPYVAVPLDGSDVCNEEESRGLLEVIAAPREEYPDVKVFTEVGMSDAATTLVRLSAGAGLVVLGADRDRNRFAPPIGRVTQQVLHHAHAPVAVVSHGRS